MMSAEMIKNLKILRSAKKRVCHRTFVTNNDLQWVYGWVGVWVDGWIELACKNTYRWSLASVEILGMRTWDHRAPGRWDRGGCRGRSAENRAAGYRRRSSAPPSGCWARSAGFAHRAARRRRHRSFALTAVRPLVTRSSGRRPAAIQPPVRCRWSCTVVPRRPMHIHLAHTRDDQ